LGCSGPAPLFFLSPALLSGGGETTYLSIAILLWYFSFVSCSLLLLIPFLILLSLSSHPLFLCFLFLFSPYFPFRTGLARGDGRLPGGLRKKASSGGGFPPSSRETFPEVACFQAAGAGRTGLGQKPQNRAGAHPRGEGPSNGEGGTKAGPGVAPPSPVGQTGRGREDTGAGGGAQTRWGRLPVRRRRGDPG